MLILLFLPIVQSAQVLLNIGLPKSGTTSFHSAVRLLNYTSIHRLRNLEYWSFGEERYHKSELEFERTGGGSIGDMLKRPRANAYSDTPVFGWNIDAIRRFYPKVKIIATNRSMASWIRSYKHNFKKKHHFLERVYKSHNPSTIWKRHQNELIIHNILTINVEDTDEHKWFMLCKMLTCKTKPTIPYPKGNPTKHY